MKCPTEHSRATTITAVDARNAPGRKRRTCASTAQGVQSSSLTASIQPPRTAPLLDTTPTDAAVMRACGQRVISNANSGSAFAVNASKSAATWCTPGPSTARLVDTFASTVDAVNAADGNETARQLDVGPKHPRGRRSGAAVSPSLPPRLHQPANPRDRRGEKDRHRKRRQLGVIPVDHRLRRLSQQHNGHHS